MAEKRIRKPLHCRFGLHGGQAGRGERGFGHIVWCLDCGTTWQSTYDGIEAGWRKRPDLRFGSEARTP